MKKILFVLFLAAVSLKVQAQVQKADTAKADSAQKEIIYKMPMDTTHQVSPEKRTDPERKPKSKNEILNDSLKKE
jgi:hypothetical protein